MNTTTHLARHMLSFQPNKDAARLCLYHFLIHHCDRETPLTPELFQRFCRLALLHEHWQTEAVALSQELQYILQHYNETYELDWSLTDITFPDYWQVVSIKNSIEGIHILEKWAKKKYKDEAQTRVFYTKDKNYLLLAQKSDGSLVVTQSTPHMLIQKGELEPLSMALNLSYDENLELKPGVTQYLRVDPANYLRFKIQNKKIQGMMIRGYIFQNKMEPNGRINQFPEVYYPLKRVEQYFIDRKSDPDYQELVQVLEKAIELFRLNHPEAESFAEAALDRGQSALENIFINDNVIQTLVDQLDSESRGR
jgi:hypothetical protein